MKKITFILCLVMAVASCFAPIGDRPPGAEFYPEHTDEQLSQFQGGQVVDREKTTEFNSESSEYNHSMNESSTAAGILAQSNQDSANAQASLTAAKEDIHGKSFNFAKVGYLAALFLVIGLAGAYGLRIYMDQKIPHPPTRKRKQ